MPHLAPVPWKTLTRVFRKAGWETVSQEGSHLKMRRRGAFRPLIIPVHGRKDVPVSVVASLLRTAGMSREEYFRLLEEG